MYGKWCQPANSLTGFPLQLPDVCYSWWVLASLKIIGRLHWIDREKLRSFILACQDEETGGFADRPGDMASTIPWFCSFSLLAGFYDSGPFGCRTSIWSKVCSESFCEFVIKARAYRNFLQYTVCEVLHCMLKTLRLSENLLAVYKNDLRLILCTG